MDRLILVFLAFIVDLLIGDPRHILHPVRVMGWLISSLESCLYKGEKKENLLARGYILLVIVVGATYLFFALINRYIAPWPILWWGVNVWFAGTVLAGKNLADSAKKVYQPLSKDDYQRAREALQEIVGRDCQDLCQEGIIRATIETVAENTSDGIIAPLFYLLIGGLPLAMTYKAINTMDSLLGYKNSRYLWFGKAAARLDDWANLIPARLTASLLVLAAFWQGKDWRLAWQVLKRDRNKHASPNSGWPEAAMAGALGVTLGGASTYQGLKVNKPVLGIEKHPLEVQHIQDSVTLLYTTYGLAIILSLVFCFFIKLQQGGTG